MSSPATEKQIALIKSRNIPLPENETLEKLTKARAYQIIRFYFTKKGEFKQRWKKQPCKFHKFRLTISPKNYLRLFNHCRSCGLLRLSEFSEKDGRFVDLEGPKAEQMYLEDMRDKGVLLVNPRRKRVKKELKELAKKNEGNKVDNELKNQDKKEEKKENSGEESRENVQPD